LRLAALCSLRLNPQSAIRNPVTLLDIIYESPALLVVNKPAGLVCHPTKDGRLSSLISRVRLYLGAEAFLVNRLDRETSGVTVVAKNSAAAGELGKLWENRDVRKEYIAIVHGAVQEDSGAIDLPLGKDEKSEIAIKDCARPDGTPARTEFLVERRFQRGGRDFSLLRLLPRTGRKHQIRIHLAALGHPIVGDKLYGGNEDLYLALVQNRLTARQREELLLPNHALHADYVGLNWRGAEMAFRAPPNADFAAFAGIEQSKAR